MITILIAKIVPKKKPSHFCMGFDSIQQRSDVFSLRNTSLRKEIE